MALGEMRGILRGFGLKMGVVTRKGFEARVRELSAGQAMLERDHEGDVGYESCALARVVCECSIVLREHDRDDSPRDGRIGGVGRMH